MFESVTNAIDAVIELTARMPAGEALAEIVAAKARLEAAQIAQTARARDDEIFVPDHRGMAGWSVEHLRLDRREAKRFTTLADRIDRFPGFASALAAGTVTVEHVEVVTTSLRKVEDAIVTDLEPVLLEAAEVCTPGDLKALLAHIKTQTDPDAAAAAERSDFARRRLSISRTIDGTVSVSGMLDAVSGQWVMNALAAFTAPARNPDGTPDDRTPGQRRVDAWVEISRRILAQTDVDTRAGTAQMLVLVDGRSLTPNAVDLTTPDDDHGPWDPPAHFDDSDDGADPYASRLALVPPLDNDDRAAEDPRWWGEPPPETDDQLHDHAPGCDCERATIPLVGITGDGAALSPAAVLQLSCDARIALAIVDDVATALLPRALRRGRAEPMFLGRMQRLVPAGLRRALVLRDAGCVYPGCTMPAAWCEAHHLIPWELDGETDLPNLALVCSFHHHQLHAHGQNVRRRPDGGWDIVHDPLLHQLLHPTCRHPTPRVA
ncbi:MAG TPA: DUF222 domain-containing protein [Mycobacteriales bacterium]|nr:DUF222 domain-containing protein [Mycobacteriales bacterium]